MHVVLNIRIFPYECLQSFVQAVDTYETTLNKNVQRQNFSDI